MSNTITKVKEAKIKPKYGVISNCVYLISTTIKKEKSLFYTAIIAAIVNAIVPFNNIFFPRFIIDELSGTYNINNLVIILIGYLISSVILAYVPFYLQGINTPKFIRVRMLIMKDILMKGMVTDYKNTEDPKFLDKVNLVNSKIYLLEEINTMIFKFIGSLLGVVGFTAILTMLNPIILILIVVSVGLTYYTNVCVNKYEFKLKDDISEVDRRGGYLYDTMSNFAYGKELRIFGICDMFYNMYQKNRHERRKLLLKYENRKYILSYITSFMNLLRDGIVYVYLIYMMLNNKINIAEFTMYFSTISAFSLWLNGIVTDLAYINANSLFISEIREFLNIENEEEKDTIKIPQGPYTIEFKNVWFKYPRSEKYVYEDISLKVRAGEKLAIVGHNGAGKTTFIKLICRFYEPEKGEILLNGINVNKFKKSEYMNLFSAIFQEVKVLAFSALENVSISPRENANEDRVIESLKKADVYDKISSLKNGIHTNLLKFLEDDGVELSGGQNQKISLARAIYKKPEIMLLDEPTSALDAIAEHKTYLKFNEVIEDKTAIYISHRLASTQFCDNIAMFENGKLIEYGTHEQLLNNNGKYADMFKVQAKYYLNGDDENV